MDISFILFNNSVKIMSFPYSIKRSVIIIKYYSLFYKILTFKFVNNIIYFIIHLFIKIEFHNINRLINVVLSIIKYSFSMNNIKNEFSRCLRLFVLIYLLSEYNSLILSISIQTKTGKIKEIEINKNGELTIMDCSSDSINVIIDVQIGWRITISFSFYYLRVISGGIVLDGYSYPISDSVDSFWIKNNNKILANGNEYNLEDKQLSFTITEDSDLLQYQHTYFEPQFICSSNSIMINDNNSYILNFNIQSKDSNNTKKAEKVEIYWEESIRGNVFSENLQITNYMVIQNNWTN